MPEWNFSKPRIPLRAVVISVAALAVPFIDTTLLQTDQSGAGTLLWLLALIPAFLLAYYRGWQGVATALAAAMAVLALAVCVVTLRGGTLPQAMLLPVIGAYIAIALATGWLSEALHGTRAEAEMLALTDDLTGLPNRRHARMFLEAQLAAAKHSGPISVVLFDLDNFKAYNDRHGHSAGDRMLRTFADVLNSVSGGEALAARYGGEEFLAVLSHCDSAGGLAFAVRVRAALRDVQKSDREPITVSAGIASSNGVPRSANELVVAADQALYNAKQQGRDRAAVANSLHAANV
jgi:diguanylate cyclase (GGDEF)-like protein